MQLLSVLHCSSFLEQRRDSLGGSRARVGQGRGQASRLEISPPLVPGHATHNHPAGWLARPLIHPLASCSPASLGVGQFFTYCLFHSLGASCLAQLDDRVWLPIVMCERQSRLTRASQLGSSQGRARREQKGQEEEEEEGEEARLDCSKTIANGRAYFIVVLAARARRLDCTSRAQRAIASVAATAAAKEDDK